LTFFCQLSMIDPLVREQIDKLLSNTDHDYITRAKHKKGALILLDNLLAPLSKPSKMPGFSWGIPAEHCITGKKLAQIEGTPCSLCYATRGRYTMERVQSNASYRLSAWNRYPTDWVNLVSAQILLATTTQPWFRWFDQGDLQSPKMLTDIIEVARRTPNVHHWLPTQERSMVKGVIPPKNLVIRVSSTKIGQIQRHSTLPTSSITTEATQENTYLCPAKQQQNRCGSCRACWHTEVQNVTYRLH